MPFKEFYIFNFLLLLFGAVSSQVPVGNWRDHLPYHSAIKIVTGKNSMYCATPYSLFTVDAENNIERLSKTNGLHETGISAINWDNETGKLIIAYINSNIDVLHHNRIININAVKQKQIPADKTVYNIYCYRQMAYLATGLGIIVIDENKYEVKDTYIIGSTGNYTKVTGITTDVNYMYAATAEGLKKAFLNSTNLADYRNWQLISTDAGLPQGPAEQVLNVQNNIVVQKGDSLFVLTGDSWKFLYTSEWSIINASESSGNLVLTQRLQTGAGRVMILHTDGSIKQIIEQASTILHPQQAAISGTDVWIADLYSGLIKSTPTGFQPYQPNSPFAVATGEMTVQNNVLWVAAGGVTAGWSNTYNTNGLYRFAGNEWMNYNTAGASSFTGLHDIISVAADARDNTLWAGSFGGGLVQLKEGSVNIFRENSLIEPSLSHPDQYRVAGLAFDRENNLWISNYGAAQNLVVRKPDGSSNKFSIPFSHTVNAVSRIVIDDVNQKWIVSPEGNGLFCFNHGSSVENTGDDRWKYFRAGPGNGNLPDNNVLCINKDKNGFIWVGTRKGIAIIQCPQNVFTNTGCEALLPVVQQDNFAGYLFRDEEVQCIATDGANRKWIGTKNGVWLLSADAEKTIYRFRENNSPLLHNDVRQIAIDPVTGEVFFATVQGICSFRSTATEGSAANPEVLVFPNPVPPSFHGTIAIRGLVNNAVVKITELNGRLVYQTRAAGGQAVWNGMDYKGKKISTGVYLVLVSDDKAQERLITKIVFIR